MKAIRIGTRPSKLALYQANLVKSLLEEKGQKTELVEIKTTGDKVTDRPLREVGGKALFLKELEHALLEERIDCAVHSLKDVPGILEPEFVIPAYLKRASPYDLIIANEELDLDQLPVKFRVGTDSPRRQNLLRYHFPWIQTSSIRGNVETRLAKLRAGEFDAIILAEAGLKRLEIKADFSYRLGRELMIPAAGQGVITIECLKKNKNLCETISGLDDEDTSSLVLEERKFLELVGGDCHTPLGAFCQKLDSGKISFDYYLKMKGQSFIGNLVEDSANGIAEKAFAKIELDS